MENNLTKDTTVMRPRTIETILIAKQRPVNPLNQPARKTWTFSIMIYLVFGYMAVYFTLSILMISMLFISVDFKTLISYLNH